MNDIKTDYANIHLQFEYDSPENENIVRCMANLFRTIQGTVPGNRGFGIDGECIAKPPDIAAEMITQDIFEKTEFFMPEVAITDSSYEVTDEKINLYLKIGKEAQDGDDTED